MSWYRTGTVTVATGSKNVTGVGTLWASSVNVGDAFALVDANGNPTGAWYEVETVTSNTALVLKQTYTGTPAPGSNKPYAVFNLVGNMTTPSFAQRLAQFFDSFQDLVDQPTTTPTASSIPIADSGGKIDSAWIKDASATVKGAVELATAAEATAGNDTTRAITPSVSGSRITFAATSTDDATSAAAAPLKSAGGLAVAKGAIIGDQARIKGVYVGGLQQTGNAAGSTVTFLFTVTTGIPIHGSIQIQTYNPEALYDLDLFGAITSIQAKLNYSEIKKVADTQGYVTFGVPTWVSSTSFKIEVTTATASSWSAYLKYNIYVGGSASLTVTVS